MTVQISLKRNDWVFHFWNTILAICAVVDESQMSGHSDFRIFNSSGASSILTWVKADTARWRRLVAHMPTHSLTFHDNHYPIQLRFSVLCSLSILSPFLLSLPRTLVQLSRKLLGGRQRSDEFIFQPPKRQFKDIFRKRMVEARESVC